MREIARASFVHRVRLAAAALVVCASLGPSVSKAQFSGSTPSTVVQQIAWQIEQQERLKNLDPFFQQLLTPVTGEDLRLSIVFDAVDGDPAAYGINRFRGRAKPEIFGVGPRGRRRVGKENERLDRNGFAAATRRIPGNLDLYLLELIWNFAGNMPYPAGNEMSSVVGLQSLPNSADDACFSDSRLLCLNGGRFQVEVNWMDSTGTSGDGAFVPTSDSSGTYYFFDPNNWEMLVKVLDACDSPFNSYWVFYAAATDVEFEITVTDTQTDLVETYSNPFGQASPAVTDTQAFATCP